ncbi:MAG: septum formation inhibitor Maf [Oscillospiraceae bacterium]|nr:septum formation inhibitor Maf [Oscillospiraceae bacterium]
MKLILASQSPRRRELLSLLNIPFEVCVSQADETMDPGAPPEQQVALVSRRKAEATPRQEDQVVIAADTIVVCDGSVMGKPHCREEACQMLERLSGRTHQVMTGLTVLWGEQCHTCTEITDVTFRSLSRQEIDRYVDSGEPMDKAGAYGIQGGAALFAEKLSGDYYNVVGLPVCRLVQVLQSMVPELMEEQQ